MALRATTECPPHSTNAIVEEIVRVTNDHSDELTPRSAETLMQLLAEQRLCLIFSGEVLAGWAVIEPLTKRLSELGMAYVKPEFRGVGVLRELLQLTAMRSERIVYATYSRELLDYSVASWGCTELKLWQVVLLSRGKFITKRLDRKTRATVRAHLDKRKPLFAITDRNRVVGTWQ